MPDYPHRRILGLNFYAGDLAGLLALTPGAGLVVVPSAPVLVDLAGDDAHRAAVEGGDIAILDSGFLVLLWLLFRREKLPRISGLKYLRALVEDDGFRQPGATFWIMPSAHEAKANLDWLNSRCFQLTLADCYVAPRYPAGPLQDETLADIIRERRPRYIIICLGGGVQERLGWYLKQVIIGDQSSAIRPLPRRNLSEGGYRPAILCTGAAIAFMSGCQADIPPWADRFFLGWLLRILRAPTRFLPRYLRSLRLAPLLWRHGGKSVIPRRT